MYFPNNNKMEVTGNLRGTEKSSPTIKKCMEAATHWSYGNGGLCRVETVKVISWIILYTYTSIAGRQFWLEWLDGKNDPIKISQIYHMGRVDDPGINLNAGLFSAVKSLFFPGLVTSWCHKVFHTSSYDDDVETRASSQSSSFCEPASHSLCSRAKRKRAHNSYTTKIHHDYY